MTTTSAERLRSSESSETVSVVWRQQRAGGAGDRRGDRIDGADMRAAGRTDPRHAHEILAYAAQRETEWRMNKTPREQEHHKQHGERVTEGGLAVQIKLEIAEQFPCMNALQAVHTAGQPTKTVGEFGQ